MPTIASLHGLPVTPLAMTRATILALFVTTPFALAEVRSIANDRLTVSYDDASGRFALACPGAPPFLTQGVLEGDATDAAITTVTDPVFGAGKRLLIRQKDHSTCALDLYPKLPFLLVRKSLRNAAADTATIQNTPLARFTLDLGKPAAELRTQGTAGLTTADKNPGSYLFLTLADPATRHGVVAGWLSHDRGSGVVFSEIQDGKVAFRSRIDYGQLRIAAGKSIPLETLAIGYFDDARLGQELFADAIAKLYQIKLPPQVNGYCTWYSDQHSGAGDETSIVELATFTARELKPYGFSFVQIDDKWQDGHTSNGPARGFDRVRPDGGYHGGMQPVAEAIGKLGLTSGIWFMPFARNYQDPEYKDRQDWFVKRPDGKPYDTDWGGTSLDLTKPEVREHLKSLVKTIHGWGYDYFKMDGLWTGSATEQIYVNDGFRDDHIGNHQPFHDPDVTNIEMMRSGLKLIRDTVGKEVFFSGCNLSQNMRTISGAIGLVDSMRIGPDNGTGWNTANDASPSLVSGPARGTRLYFLHGRVWYNDPDPNYVRASIPLEHARFITSWVGISGQFNLNSDWIPALPAERLELLKRTMPAHHATARPVDYFDTPLPAIWRVSEERSGGARQVLGLFNWDANARPIECDAAKAGLDPAKTYQAFDFWAGKPLPAFHGSFKFEVPATACRVISVREAAGHPQLISTSRHVTQGIIDVSGETWNAANRTLSAASEVVANDPYELRIAGLQDGGRTWKPVAIGISAADTAAGVTATLGETTDVLRATLRTPNNRQIRWSIRFDSLP